jgi:hypothetical protein
MMTAYEFTKPQADFTSKVKKQSFEASVITLQIELAHKERNPREDNHYIECKSIFYDVTDSCNKQEATNWMTYFMSNAIAYGIVTHARDWQYKFLAAYDIFNQLTSMRREW